MKTMLLTLAAALLAGGPALAADGKALYAVRCASCHSVTGKSGPGGPSLRGVSGRAVASLSDYAYSAGLKAKGGTWTAASLDAYLAAPSRFAPGGKMFVSVPAAADRAALVAYLATLK
ncbi:MAG TPA: c-type cytochrome [Caulobacteraceae bacterium]|nr:c-type cytochrome [Caulobacteraceae bacterium]